MDKQEEAEQFLKERLSEYKKAQATGNSYQRKEQLKEIEWTFRKAFNLTVGPYRSLPSDFFIQKFTEILKRELTPDEIDMLKDVIPAGDWPQAPPR